MGEPENDPELQQLITKLVESPKRLESVLQLSQMEMLLPVISRRYNKRSLLHVAAEEDLLLLAQIALQNGTSRQGDSNTRVPSRRR